MAPLARAYPWSMLRSLLALVAASAIAAVGAVLLGEFAFSGVSVVFSAVLLGLLVGEVTVTVAKTASPILAVAASLLTVVSLMGAAWTFSSQRLGDIAVSGWFAVGAGAVTAWIRARPRSIRADTQLPPGQTG